MNVAQSFSPALTRWYLRNARILPWRETSDPYKIWLSEIILQQTRVNQGLPYYYKFVEAYPTVTDLAKAEERDVLRLWQGLGYYSRARNLHQTARYIASELNGKFPGSYKELIKLKGVGKYTAAAIASFAYQEKVAVVDGNVYRVLARVFGIDTDIAGNKAEKEFSDLANSLLPDSRPDIHNQAIMEFGALQCTPATPLCMYCPLADVCVAKQTGKQHELPVKSKKVKVRHRYFNYFVIKDSSGNVWMRERTDKDIWQGLYDFWLIETEQPLTDIQLFLERDLLKSLPHHDYRISIDDTEYKHVLTHQVINARFLSIVLGNNASYDKKVFAVPGLQRFTLDEVRDLPKPVLINNFLNKS
jgi:A/G-specific adenine glycosylase